VVRFVFAHRRDEAIGRFLRMPDPVLLFVGAPGLIDQLAQRHGGAAPLLGQPFPVPRQKRDFAGDHAQLGTSRTARSEDRGVFGCGRRTGDIRQPLQHILSGAAKVDIDRTAGFAIEYKNRRFLVPIERLFRRAGDGAEIAAGDTAVTFEGDVSVGPWIHGLIPRLARQVLSGYIAFVNNIRVISALRSSRLSSARLAPPSTARGASKFVGGIAMLTVHHLNNPRSQRVLWLLEELGVPYEIVRYQRQPDLR